jgi:hypothetical protein
MEVLHGDIKITLSDQDAIRGLQRTRAQVKRGLSQISREKAIIKVEGDLKDLDRDLKQARAKLMKLEGMQAEVKLGLRDGNFKKEIALARAEVKAMDGQTIDLKLELQNQRQAMADLKRIEGEQQKIINLKAKDKAATEAAATAEQKASVAERERQLRNEARMQQQALDMDRSRNFEAAKLQESYGRASKEYQRLQQTIRRKRLMSDEVKLDLDVQSNRALAEMEALRAKLKMMNRDAIDIPVDIKERGLERLANLGNLTTRIGPISGSLKQVATGGLVLGPIITGLVGSITALAGAIGAGLTGAAGVAGGALGALGLSLGGVGALTLSLFRDFKNLNSFQDTYHKNLLKLGPDAEKTVAALKQFNHALGAVSPTTREAFNAVGKLQDRWRGLRKEVKPDFYAALGQAATTANTDFNVFSRGTTKAFRAVSKGFQDWMRGLRSGEGQNVIFRLMDNGNRAIKPLMHALGQLGGVLGRVLAQFSNYLPGLITGFDDWATGIGNASKNTEGLSTGVDHLMTSFHQTLGVVTAFSRVVIEMTRAAMGPGGGFLQNITDGLNGIADSIHNNPTRCATSLVTPSPRPRRCSVRCCRWSSCSWSSRPFCVRLLLRCFP